MSHMVLDCPHCGSKRITFDFIGDSPAQVQTGDPLRMWNAFMRCRHCHKGVVVILEDLVWQLRGRGSLTPSQLSGDPLQNDYVIRNVYPKRECFSIPENLNESIEKDFIEAVDNLNNGNHTSAGMMFRRVLQRSTTALIKDPSTLKSKRLKQRVDILASEGIITEAMRDWADIIRLEGNSANHDEEEYGQDEFSSEDATQLHRFTELFLTYAFTLPARVREYHTQSKPTSDSHKSDFMPPRKPDLPQLNTGYGVS